LEIIDDFMIKETLLKLGLTSNEVEIYLTLLNKGEISVNEIGSSSGLHRQVCYDALDRLLEKGVVSYIIKNNKKFFKALKPDKIIDYLDKREQEIEQKKQDINSIMPQLLGMFLTEKEETEVEVIKGKMVLRTIYNDIIRTLKETKKEDRTEAEKEVMSEAGKRLRKVMCAMGIEETKFLEFDKIAIEQYINRMRKNKFKEKLLAKKSTATFFEGLQSEYRLIPDHLFNPNPTHIYGNNVAIIIWGNPIYGIIIRNKQVADANRKYFEMLWKMAKKR